MSTLILNNPSKVEDILNLIPTKPSSKGFAAPASKSNKKPKSEKVCSSTDIDQLTKVLNEFAEVLPKKWKNLSNERREELTKFAYSYLEAQDTVTITQFLWMQIRILNLKLQRKFNTEIAVNKAIEKLVHSVLDVIETNNDYYQQMLNEAVSEINLNCVGTPIKQGTVNEWLDSILD